MDHLTERERRLAILFYLCSGIATILWWLTLIFFPSSKPIFLGSEFSEKFFWILMAPDLISAFVLATWMVALLVKRSTVAISIAWMHVGAQGYALAISVALTIIDPEAYWGVVGMTFSVGCALAFAIRLQGFSVLWGKFRFKDAPNRNTGGHIKRAVLQTIVMWFIFYGLIPGIIVLLEYRFKTNVYWLSSHPLFVFGLLIFVGSGLIGLWSGYTVSSLGEGTPLPSDRTRRFVIAGPYRYIRNPMAFSSILQGSCIGLMFGSPLVIVYAMVGGVWWDILVRWQEESDLEVRFGDEYRTYRAQVRCWIPSLKGVRQQVLDAEHSES